MRQLFFSLPELKFATINFVPQHDFTRKGKVNAHYPGRNHSASFIRSQKAHSWSSTERTKPYFSSLKEFHHVKHKKWATFDYAVFQELLVISPLISRILRCRSTHFSLLYTFWTSAREHTRLPQTITDIAPFPRSLQRKMNFSLHIDLRTLKPNIGRFACVTPLRKACDLDCKAPRVIGPTAGLKPTNLFVGMCWGSQVTPWSLKG